MMNPAGLTRTGNRTLATALAIAVLTLAALAIWPGSASSAPDPILALDPLSEAEVDLRIQEWLSDSRAPAMISVTDPRIAEGILRLSERSERFREAWEMIVRTGTPVLVGGPAQLDEIMPANIRESRSWAGMTLTWADRSRKPTRMAVAIRVDWLAELHDRYGNPESAFLDALDDLIVHEVYGHLAPVVEAQSTRAHCADPRRGERAVDSCVGQRELEIRRDRARFTRANEGKPPIVHLAGFNEQ